MLHIFMERPTSAVSNAQITLESKYQRLENEGIVTLYFKVVKYLLDKYAINDVITPTDADMMCSTQSLNSSPTEYAKALCD